jgi:hypothetical protein
VTAVPTLETPRGHTQVSSRAMTRLVAVVAAETLGIAPDDISVDLAATRDALSLTVKVPLGALADGQESGNDDTDTVTIAAEERIRDTVTVLTGAQIADVRVRPTTTRLRLPTLGD